MEKAKKKNIWFSKITTREEALEIIKSSAIGFWVLAGLQAALGFVVAPALFIDAILIAILAGVLFKWRSRVAAVLLLVLSSLVVVSTLLNILQITQQGGTNIVLALIFAWTAARAVEATFKLQGQFKDNAQSAQPLPETSQDEPQL